MQLTKNFTLEELTASTVSKTRGIDNTPGAEQKANLKRLAETVLQPIRNRLGKPVTVTSGYRCPALNKAVGGVSTSQHLNGEAADITTTDNKRLWSVITEMMKSGEITVGQLIDEKNLSWVHISLPTARHRNQILKL